MTFLDGCVEGGQYKNNDLVGQRKLCEIKLYKTAATTGIQLIYHNEIEDEGKEDLLTYDSHETLKVKHVDPKKEPETETENK